MRANNVEQEAKHIHACMFSDDLFIVLALLLSCSLVLSYSKYALFLALVLSLFSDNSVGEREKSHSRRKTKEGPRTYFIWGEQIRREGGRRRKSEICISLPVSQSL